MGGASPIDSDLVGLRKRRVIQFECTPNEKLPFFDRQGGKFGQDLLEAHAGILADDEVEASTGARLGEGAG
jgi:hypothetical protein